MRKALGWLMLLGGGIVFLVYGIVFGLSKFVGLLTDWPGTFGLQGFGEFIFWALVVGGASLVFRSGHRIVNG